MEIILVDDETEIRSAISQFMDLSGYKTLEYSNAPEALHDITRDKGAIIISDIRMPDMDGLNFLEHIMAIDPQIPVILITGHGDVQMAVRAMQTGAYDFLEKPFDPENLLSKVERAMKARQLTLENRALRNALGDSERIKRIFMGESNVIANFRENLLGLANRNTHSLVKGEMGTGRTVAARALHAAGPNNNSPVHIVNCGSLSEEALAEVIFDGTSPMAFFKSVRPITLILESVDQLPEQLQERLKAEIGTSDQDQKQLTRVIGTMTLPQTKPLAAGLELAFGACEITVPSIRERVEDVLSIFQINYENYAHDYGYAVEEIDAECASLLLSGNWPGNMRQVRILAEKVATGDKQLSLAKRIENALDITTSSTRENGSPLKTQVDAFEKMIIHNALQRHKGAIAPILEELSLPRRTLNEKMTRYGLSRADYS